jgi:hypothetical protein
MLKYFSLILICLGIYIGINYSDEIEQIISTDAFEQVQVQVEEQLEIGKEKLTEKLDEFKD